MNERPAPADDVEVPGLAAERTDLAWSRTSLAMGVIAAALLRRVWMQFASVTARVAVFGLLAATGGAWLAAIWWSVTVGRAGLEGRRTATPRVLRRLSAATVMVAVIALVLAVAPYPT